MSLKMDPKEAQVMLEHQEMRAIPHPTRIEKLRNAVLPAVNVLPQNSLPGWKDYPLEKKFPVVPAPNKEFKIGRNALGEKIFVSSRCEFDTDDPQIVATPRGYESLHDPHLKDYFMKHPRVFEKLIEHGLVEEDGTVNTSMKEFNQYRAYLGRLRNCVVNKDLGYQAKMYGAQRDQVRRIDVEDKKVLREAKSQAKQRHLENLKRERQRRELAAQLKDVKYYERSKEKEREQALMAVKREEMREKVRARLSKLKKAERRRVRRMILEWYCKQLYADMMRKARMEHKKKVREKDLESFIKAKREFQKKKLKWLGNLEDKMNAEKECAVKHRIMVYDKMEAGKMERMKQKALEEEIRAKREVYLARKFGQKWLAFVRQQREYAKNYHDSVWRVRQQLVEMVQELKNESGKVNFTNFITGLIKMKPGRNSVPPMSEETRQIMNYILDLLIKSAFDTYKKQHRPCTKAYENLGNRRRIHGVKDLTDKDFKEPDFKIRDKVYVPFDKPYFPCKHPCTKLGVQRYEEDPCCEDEPEGEDLDGLYDEAETLADDEIMRLFGKELGKEGKGGDGGKRRGDDGSEGSSGIAEKLVSKSITNVADQLGHGKSGVVKDRERPDSSGGKPGAKVPVGRDPSQRSTKRPPGDSSGQVLKGKSSGGGKKKGAGQDGVGADTGSSGSSAVAEKLVTESLSNVTGGPSESKVKKKHSSKVRFGGSREYEEEGYDEDEDFESDEEDEDEEAGEMSSVRPGEESEAGRGDGGEGVGGDGGSEDTGSSGVAENLVRKSIGNVASQLGQGKSGDVKDEEEPVSSDGKPSGKPSAEIPVGQDPSRRSVQSLEGDSSGQGLKGKSSRRGSKTGDGQDGVGADVGSLESSAVAEKLVTESLSNVAGGPSAGKISKKPSSKSRFGGEEEDEEEGYDEGEDREGMEDEDEEVGEDGGVTSLIPDEKREAGKGDGAEDFGGDAGIDGTGSSGLMDEKLRSESRKSVAGGPSASKISKKPSSKGRFGAQEDEEEGYDEDEGQEGMGDEDEGREGMGDEDEGREGMGDEDEGQEEMDDEDEGQEEMGDEVEGMKWMGDEDESMEGIGDEDEVEGDDDGMPSLLSGKKSEAEKGVGGVGSKGTRSSDLAKNLRSQSRGNVADEPSAGKISKKPSSKGRFGGAEDDEEEGYDEDEDQESVEEDTDEAGVDDGVSSLLPGEESEIGKDDGIGEGGIDDTVSSAEGDNLEGKAKSVNSSLEAESLVKGAVVRAVQELVCDPEEGTAALGDDMFGGKGRSYDKIADLEGMEDEDEDEEVGEDDGISRFLPGKESETGKGDGGEDVGDDGESDVTGSSGLVENLEGKAKSVNSSLDAESLVKGAVVRAVQELVCDPEEATAALGDDMFGVSRGYDDIEDLEGIEDEYEQEGEDEGISSLLPGEESEAGKGDGGEGVGDDGISDVTESSGDGENLVGKAKSVNSSLDAESLVKVAVVRAVQGLVCDPEEATAALEDDMFGLGAGRAQDTPLSVSDLQHKPDTISSGDNRRASQPQVGGGGASSQMAAADGVPEDGALMLPRDASCETQLAVAAKQLAKSVLPPSSVTSSYFSDMNQGQRLSSVLSVSSSLDAEGLVKDAVVRAVQGLACDGGQGSAGLTDDMFGRGAGRAQGTQLPVFDLRGAITSQVGATGDAPEDGALTLPRDASCETLLDVIAKHVATSVLPPSSVTSSYFRDTNQEQRFSGPVFPLQNPNDQTGLAVGGRLSSGGPEAPRPTRVSTDMDVERSGRMPSNMRDSVVRTLSNVQRQLDAIRQELRNYGVLPRDQQRGSERDPQQ